jgi:transposase
VARRRRHAKAFKIAAVARMEGAADVRALAAELGIDRGLLYKWQQAYQLGGEAALRFPGERSDGVSLVDAPVAVTVPDGPASSSRVLTLERKIAEQALELDFFRAALQHFAARRRETGGSGGTGSTP